MGNMCVNNIMYGDRQKVQTFNFYIAAVVETRRIDRLRYENKDQDFSSKRYSDDDEEDRKCLGSKLV